MVTEPPQTPPIIYQTAPNPPERHRPWYRTWWIWGLALLGIVIIVGAAIDGTVVKNQTVATTERETTKQSSEGQDTPAPSPLGGEPDTSKDTSPTEDREPRAQATAEPTKQDTPDVPREYSAALESAKHYLEFTTFSYQGLYHQLTSEYGSQFPPEAAQYAMDNLDVDWNEQALRSAEEYLEFSAFSYLGLFDQLTSEYGESFTPEQAQYAVDSVNADWNEQALKSALSYLEFMPMSDAELFDQLVSEYGEQFTPEQAQYAINNLP